MVVSETDEQSEERRLAIQFVEWHKGPGREARRQMIAHQIVSAENFGVGGPMLTATELAAEVERRLDARPTHCHYCGHELPEVS